MFASKFTPKSQGVSMLNTDATLDREQPETLEEGIAHLKVVDITDLGLCPGPYGTKRKLKVSLESNVPSVKQPGTKVTIQMTCTASLSDQSNFGIFVKSLGLDNAVAKFPIGQMKDIEFDGVITNTTSDKTGIVYSNLDKVVGGTVKIPAVQTI